MRRQYFEWTYLVLAIVLTAYGGFTLMYHFNHDNRLSILSLVFLIAGSIMLLFYICLRLVDVYRKKKHPVAINQPKEEITDESVKEMPKQEENKKDPYQKDTKLRYESPNYSTNNQSRYDKDDVSATIRKTGFGLVLDINGNRIKDMRTNAYYRVEGGYVKQEGSGPLYRIEGNRVGNAYGSFLYEINGDNINKTLGGYYASISGNVIQLFDLSERYEINGSLNLNMKLAVIALLFGTY